MSYAIRTDGQGWRAVGGPDDVGPDEVFSTERPLDVSPVPDYRALRAADYPPMADYLDGVVKGDQAQVAAYIAACLAVKARYPKP